MTSSPSQHIAPVGFSRAFADPISESLAILSTVYNYNHWIFDNIRDYLGESILEVGSGLGNISQFLLNAGRLVCIEPHAPYREYLENHFRQHMNVAVYGPNIEECPNDRVPSRSFDSVVCLNVLEHIEDDVTALAVMRDLLAPGGRLIILVPAAPWAYGSMDAAMGHCRRYSRRALKVLFRNAGLAVEKASYMNAVGLLGWWWHGKVLRRVRLSDSSTRAFDRLVPYLSALERLLPLPAGQSLVMVGMREESSA